MPAFSVNSELLCYFPSSCQCFTNLVVWCLSSSLLVFRAFSLYHLHLSVQLVLAICCRPFIERARAVSIFSLYDEIYLLQLCLHPDPLITDFVLP